MKRRATPATEARAFNDAHPIGTRVRYWRGAREGAGAESTTRTEAKVLGDHTAVVWLDGVAGCIALSHVEVIKAPSGDMRSQLADQLDRALGDASITAFVREHRETIVAALRATPSATLPTVVREALVQALVYVEQGHATRPTEKTLGLLKKIDKILGHVVQPEEERKITAEERSDALNQLSGPGIFKT